MWNEALLIEGFYFTEIHLDPKLCQEVLDKKNQVPFERELKADSTEYPTHLKLPEEILNEIRTSVIAKLPKELHPFLVDASVTGHITAKGERLRLHSDYRAGNWFDVLLWICPETPFIGREFVYGKLDSLKKIKVYTGLVCVVDNTDRTRLHGVTRLESNVEVATLLLLGDL